MIRLIAAMDSKRGIAKDGRQPWKLPADEQYFRDQTLSHGAVVVMGRLTYDVIGHPLTGRISVVATRSDWSEPGVTLTNDLKAFIASATTDLWIIGGADIYAQTLDLADELYLTEIDHDFACDQFFPEYEKGFHLEHQSPIETQNGLTFRYKIYKAIAKKPATRGWLLENGTD